MPEIKNFKFLKNLNIKENFMPMEPGAVYNVFACGHVIKNTEDEHEMAYYPETQRRNRTCPICVPKPTALAAKIKVCICGRRYEGIRIQDSDKCRSCKKIEGYAVKKTPEEIAVRKAKFNKKLEDLSRSDCYHRYLGKNCLNKYKNCQAIPCKNCPDYEQFDIGVDPYRSNGDVCYTTVNFV